jgi:hypothetical protein
MKFFTSSRFEIRSYFMHRFNFFYFDYRDITWTIKRRYYDFVIVSVWAVPYTYGLDISSFHTLLRFCKSATSDLYG